MNIVIHKYGGTSVDTTEGRERIVKNIKEDITNGFSPVVVVSAIGRNPEPYATDTIANLLAKKDNCDSRTLDMIMSCGEVISACVIADVISKSGIDSIAMTGWQAGIITDKKYGNACIKGVNATYLRNCLNNGMVPVIAGFQGISEDGNITTLGRGGSDITATTLGSALGAEKIKIYTDVDGVMSADPKNVDGAKLIQNIAYDDVHTLADYGAQVVHPEAIKPAREASIPVEILNTKTDNGGTNIVDIKGSESINFTAIVDRSNLNQIKIKASNDFPHNVFTEFAEDDISIDMINIYVDTKNFVIDAKDKNRLLNILKRYNLEHIAVENCTKITLVSNTMHGVPGVMAKIINILNQENIDVLHTSDSSNTISVLVSDKDAKKAINILHLKLIENK